MPLSAGSRLGPYEIESAVGAGGMGEVYRARDTRLDRAVAIKTLPEALSHDPERRARSQLEARSIAALTHPHICALHDVGHQDGVDYLVMELLEGETLADRISRGPLPVSQALTYSVQIADGLAKAHGHGIVHRDLKPANVMLTRSGAKLLDFGLAKQRVGSAPKDVAVTKTGPVTSEGQILGTLNYMSPEQLNGKSVDARSDIFAFGLIVFAMITGKRAFDGPSQASVIGQILHTDPPSVSEVVPDAAPALARLVITCLAKDPEDRWSSAHDVLLQFKGIADGEAPALPAAARPRKLREWLAWCVAGVATVAAIALGVTRLADRRAPVTGSDVDVLAVLPPAGTIQPFGDAPQISPDGRHVAFVATDQAGKT
jgi:serine/threonine protein kinase